MQMYQPDKNMGFLLLPFNLMGLIQTSLGRDSGI